MGAGRRRSGRKRQVASDEKENSPSNSSSKGTGSAPKRSCRAPLTPIHSNEATDMSPAESTLLPAAGEGAKEDKTANLYQPESEFSQTHGQEATREKTAETCQPGLIALQTSCEEVMHLMSAFASLSLHTWLSPRLRTCRTPPALHACHCGATCRHVTRRAIVL